MRFVHVETWYGFDTASVQMTHSGLWRSVGHVVTGTRPGGGRDGRCLSWNFLPVPGAPVRGDDPELKQRFWGSPRPSPGPAASREHPKRRPEKRRIPRRGHKTRDFGDHPACSRPHPDRPWFSHLEALPRLALLGEKELTKMKSADNGWIQRGGALVEGLGWFARCRLWRPCVCDQVGHAPGEREMTLVDAAPQSCTRCSGAGGPQWDRSKLAWRR